MDAIEALKTRRSIRAYTGEPVTREQVEEIVDCGRLAANARNRQPWEFVAVTDKETLAKLAAAALEHAKFVAASAATVVVLGVAEDPYYVEGCSNAAHNMMVAARALGLGACWAQLDKRPFAADVRQVVGAPETHNPLCMVAIGHPMGHPEKPKRALAEVLHWEKF